LLYGIDGTGRVGGDKENLPGERDPIGVPTSTKPGVTKNNKH
jgi:hypothetical protein